MLRARRVGPTGPSKSASPSKNRQQGFCTRFRKRRPILFWSCSIVFAIGLVLLYFGLCLLWEIAPLYNFYILGSEEQVQSFWITPKVYETKSLIHSDQIIPPIIHRTEKDNLPIKLQKLYGDTRNSCTTENVDYEYEIWTDARSRAFVADNFPDFLEMYDSYPHNIQRVDAVRLFAVYKYGGVYMDADIGCKRPFEPLQHNYGCIFPKTDPFGVSNDFFMCRPEHPFVKMLVDNLKTRHDELPRILHYSKYAYVMLSTGPVYVDHYLKKYMEEVQTSHEAIEARDQVWILTDKYYSNTSGGNSSFLFMSKGVHGMHWMASYWVG
jgi:mannosyltransferase OCH1-like enzyme